MKKIYAALLVWVLVMVAPWTALANNIGLKDPAIVLTPKNKVMSIAGLPAGGRLSYKTVLVTHGFRLNSGIVYARDFAVILLAADYRKLTANTPFVVLLPLSSGKTMRLTFTSTLAVAGRPVTLIPTAIELVNSN